MKTLWVVARDVSGDLVVEGQRLDGPGRLTFATRQGSVPSESLVIAEATTRPGVVPGGAPQEILRRYAFWPSGVYYPSLGCWELTARVGSHEVKIVQNLTDYIETECSSR